MQNLNNIKSLNENQIQSELSAIISYFKSNKFYITYINQFELTCKKLLLNNKNKSIE